MSDERFPKRMRLLRASDFEGVFAARNSAADHAITLYGAANDLDYPRLGLTVSRRIGGAPQRNRWKRLLREAFRLTQHSLPPVDLVCIPRIQSPPPLSELKEAMQRLAARIQTQIDRTSPHCGKKQP